MAKRLVVADIDGTQLREDIHKSAYDAHDLELAATLKSKLEILRSTGVIVVHSTNRMADLVLEDIGGLLAEADYITCSASTKILKFNRDTGTYQDDTDYEALVEACHFVAEDCRAQAAQFPELELTAAVNQTPRKVSYTFAPGTPLERRHEIHDALQAQQPDGIKVFMVEDRDNHIVDFLPAACTKQEVVKFILAKENVAPEFVIAFGNSNNDIPLMRKDFTCVAVGDARASLVEHIKALQTSGEGRYTVAPHSSTKGVLWGLDHFKI